MEILAAIALSPMIHVLVAVLVGLIVCYCVGLFIADGKILTVIRLIVGLMILLYSLNLFGIVA